MRLPDHIVAASPQTADRLAAILRGRIPVTVAPNGIDLAEVDRACPDTVPADLVVVGRLMAHKRVGMLLDAVALLHEHRVSQLPVVSAHDSSTVVGAIGERGLLKRAAEDPAVLDAEVIHVMEAPFPAVSEGDPVREAVELLVGDQQALLVTRDGRSEGLVTRTDLLEALVA